MYNYIPTARGNQLTMCSIIGHTHETFYRHQTVSETPTTCSDYKQINNTACVHLSVNLLFCHTVV